MYTFSCFPVFVLYCILFFCSGRAWMYTVDIIRVYIGSKALQCICCHLPRYSYIIWWYTSVNPASTSQPHPAPLPSRLGGSLETSFLSDGALYNSAWSSGKKELLIKNDLDNSQIPSLWATTKQTKEEPHFPNCPTEAINIPCVKRRFWKWVQPFLGTYEFASTKLGLRAALVKGKPLPKHHMTVRAIAQA